MYTKFADDTKLGGALDTLEHREALWRHPEKLEGWAITNHTKFNKLHFCGAALQLLIPHLYI